MSEPQAWIAIGAACAAAGAGWWAAVNGSRTLKQVRNDSRERGRPMVAAELRDHQYAAATQLLVVRNYGLTVARNVQVTFEPEIADPDIPEQSVTPYLKRRYAGPLSVLTPGMELDNVWYSGRPAAGGGWENYEPMPDKVIVHIAYDGPDGSRYHDDFALDVNVIKERTTSTASNDPAEVAKAALKTLDGIAASIQGIRKATAKGTP